MVGYTRPAFNNRSLIAETFLITSLLQLALTGPIEPVAEVAQSRHDELPFVKVAVHGGRVDLERRKLGPNRGNAFRSRNDANHLDVLDASASRNNHPQRE